MLKVRGIKSEPTCEGQCLGLGSVLNLSLDPDLQKNAFPKPGGTRKILRQIRSANVLPRAMHVVSPNCRYTNISRRVETRRGVNIVVAYRREGINHFFRRGEGWGFRAKTWTLDTSECCS
jgi:hypothetical protein